MSILYQCSGSSWPAKPITMHKDHGRDFTSLPLNHGRNLTSLPVNCWTSTMDHLPSLRQAKYQAIFLTQASRAPYHGYPPIQVLGLTRLRLDLGHGVVERPSLGEFHKWAIGSYIKSIEGCLCPKGTLHIGLARSWCPRESIPRGIPQMSLCNSFTTFRRPLEALKEQIDL